MLGQSVVCKQWARYRRNTRKKQQEAKEKARRKKCDVRFSFGRRKRASKKNYMRIGVRKLFSVGLVSARMWRGYAVGILHQQRG